MVGYVGLAMLVYLVDIGVTSSKPPIYIYFRASHMILYSAWTLFGTWCAYTYRWYQLRREGVIVIIIEALLLGGIITASILKFIDNGNVSSLFFVYYVIMGVQTWSAFVLLRRSVIASKHRQDSQATMQTNLPNPVAQPAHSMRIFALLFAFSFTSSLGTIIFGAPLSHHIGQMVLLLGV